MDRSMRGVRPEALGLLGEAVDNDARWLDSIAARQVPGEVTLWEMKQMMRSDALMMVRMGFEANAGWARIGTEHSDREIAAIGKYMEMARETYDPVTTSFRIDPYYDVGECWSEAAKWANEAGESDSMWVGECDMSRTHRFISENSEGLKTALAFMGVVMRYDTRSSSIQALSSKGHRWFDIDDRWESELRQNIGMLFKFARRGAGGRGKFRAVAADWSNSAWSGVLNAVLNASTVDSFEQWLGILEPWDTKPRLDSWIMDAGLKLAPSASEALASWVCSSILMCACARTFDPGLKHDVIPVLVGPQGIAKSTALAWLLPPEQRQIWFSDSLRLSADEKRRVEALQGAVIVEAAEMSGATTADIESLKAFLSRTNDRVRLAYRRNPEAHPRMCSIVGTANGDSVLPNDPTGNRRFATLMLADGNSDSVRDYLDANRTQLWAEAAYRSGTMKESLRLPKALEEIQASANEQVRSADSLLEEAIHEFLHLHASRIGGNEPFELHELAMKCGILKGDETPQQLSQRDVRRLNRILETFGCKSQRTMVKGIRKRYIYLPKTMYRPD